jgi:hypothetical protein
MAMKRGFLLSLRHAVKAGRDLRRKARSRVLAAAVSIVVEVDGEEYYREMKEQKQNYEEE